MHKWDALEIADGRGPAGRDRPRERTRRSSSCPRTAASRESIPAREDPRDRAPRPADPGGHRLHRAERVDLAACWTSGACKHQVLNAKHHQREAEIVAQAGRKGAVTIATNMAGRGTDIILGGNPEAMAWAQLQEKYPTRLDVPPDEWDALVNEIEGREQTKAEGPRGGGDGRAAHHRQRAARGPPHRLAASRPLRPAGRSRQQPLLPLAGRRPDADLRRRMGEERPHPAGHEGGRGHRKPHGLAPHRGRPEEGRRAQLRNPQEPPRIRRGHGRAAQAGLRLPPADPRRRQLQAADPRHDRRAGRAATSTSSWPATTAPRSSPNGRARSWASSSTPATSAAWTSPPPRNYALDQAERKAEGQVLDAIEENLPEEADPRGVELGGPGQDGQHPLAA